MTELEKEKLYKKAKKRLDQERGFYMHLAIYIIMNIVIAFFKIKVDQHIDNHEFRDWLFWNIVLTPLLWGIGLLGHGIWVFKGRAIKKKWLNNSMYGQEWEERKIKEIMKKDDF